MFEKKFGLRPLLTMFDDADLEFAYEVLGYPIPAPYLEFLKMWNGGFFMEECAEPFYRTPGVLDPDGEFIGVSYLYGLGPVYMDYHVLHERSEYEFEERVPNWFLPIGQWGLEPHPRFCIGLAGDVTGQIFHWDPGVVLEEGKNIQTTEHLAFIANDFYEFWEMIDCRKTTW